MKWWTVALLLFGCGGETASMSHMPMTGNVDVYEEGDSTTYGTGSTSGNGYRGPLNTQLDTDRTNGDIPAGLTFTYVGNTHSGTAPTDNHRGVPSSTTVYHISDTLTQLPTVVTTSQVIVILQIGLNDATDDTLTAQFPTHYLTLVRRIHNLLRSKNPRFIFGLLNNSAGADPVLDARIAIINAALPALWVELAREGIEFETISWAIPGIGIHPNDAGYQQIAVTGPTGFNYHEPFRRLIGYPIP